VPEILVNFNKLNEQNFLPWTNKSNEVRVEFHRRRQDLWYLGRQVEQQKRIEAREQMECKGKEIEGQGARGSKRWIDDVAVMVGWLALLCRK